jgi:hypothetical protein
MAKTEIIDALGVRPLLMPTLLNDAVAANERAKYLLTLLQVAAANADDPKSDAPPSAPTARRVGSPKRTWTASSRAASHSDLASMQSPRLLI